MAAELLLVRHGETACSRGGLFCGRCDTRLVDDGVRTVTRLAGQLARLSLSALVTSPAPRAVQTAHVLAGPLRLRPAEDPRLAETSFGGWEGLRVTSLTGVAAYESWTADPVLFAPPGGEAGAAVLARGLAAARDLAAAHPGERVLVVSHKHVIRLIVAHARGLPLREYRSAVPAPAGSVVTLRLDSHGLAIA